MTTPTQSAQQQRINPWMNPSALEKIKQSPSTESPLHVSQAKAETAASQVLNRASQNSPHSVMKGVPSSAELMNLSFQRATGSTQTPTQLEMARLSLSQNGLTPGELVAPSAVSKPEKEFDSSECGSEDLLIRDDADALADEFMSRGISGSPNKAGKRERERGSAATKTTTKTERNQQKLEELRRNSKT